MTAKCLKRAVLVDGVVEIRMEFDKFSILMGLLSLAVPHSLQQENRHKVPHRRPVALLVLVESGCQVGSVSQDKLLEGVRARQTQGSAQFLKVTLKGGSRGVSRCK